MVIDLTKLSICSHKSQRLYTLIITEIPRLKYEVRRLLYPENKILKIQMCSDCKTTYDKRFSNDIVIVRPSILPDLYTDNEKEEYLKLINEQKNILNFIKKEDNLYYCDKYPNLQGAYYVFYQYEIEDFFDLCDVIY